MREPLLGCLHSVWAGDIADPVRAFRDLQRWDPFVILESAAVHRKTGRKSLIGLGPRVLHQKEEIPGGGERAKLDQAVTGWQRSCGGNSCSHLFALLSYEYKNAFENLPQTAKDDSGFPNALLVAARDTLIWDHFAHTLCLHCSYDPTQLGSKRQAMRRCKEIETSLRGKDEVRPEMGSDPSENEVRPFKKGVRPFHLEEMGSDLFFEDRSDPISGLTSSFRNDIQNPRFFPHSWQSNMSREEYLKKVQTIQRYIAAGDIYQANLSQRFQLASDIPGLDLYEILRSVNPSAFGGYWRGDHWELISCSPERLIVREEDTVSTRPIAGTRPRGCDALSDLVKQSEMLLSPKERAEHIMLVDLERNDLGKVCQKGSVRVDEMMTVEKYSHVQHIVSDVCGLLRSGTSFADILAAVFPGGTITGVPKIRCMEILDSLEPTTRGPYTGSFGYINGRGDFDLAITIRTVLKAWGKLSLQVGAGIVADSSPEAEYQETLDKAKAMALAVEICSAKITHSEAAFGNNSLF